MPSKRRKICTRSVILGEIESFRKYKGLSIFPEPPGKQLIRTARSPGNEEKVHEIREAGWGEVGKFRVGKNYWTSTGANLRKTGAFLGGFTALFRNKKCVATSLPW